MYLAQTDKTDDNRYDLEMKSTKLTKEMNDLLERIAGIKGTCSSIRAKDVSDII